MAMHTTAADVEVVPERYATFTGRFRALLIDTAILVGGMVVVLIGSELADGIPGSSRIAWLFMFGLVFLYEPLFIWRRGATIGHARNRLRVVASGTGQAPGLVRSFARYFSKVTLGLPSFITMALTRRHQAVHDWLTRTTVQVTPDAGFSEVEFHLERSDDSETLLPSRTRRAMAMVAYLVGIFVVYVTVLTVIDPQGCARDQTCTGIRRIGIEAAALSWLALSLAAVAATWKGLLPGARRIPIQPDAPVA